MDSGASTVKKPGHRWPEGAVVYHIYPRSLQDSNGDGVGDLPGITGRLDYFSSLGVNVIWLSPFYPSPMADFGYDVADYCGVDTLFGTLDDFRALLRAAARHHIKVVIDLVPNHTSDEHPWFRASSKSLSNGYSDWYIWRDGRTAEDGRQLPPNNWLDALTGRPAWEWSAERRQYYLHSFHTKQPDLNWANPDVREAIKAVMRFWLDEGVDGFRVDAVYWMAKDPLLRDDPPNPGYVAGDDPPYESLRHSNSCGWPAVYSHLNELASVLKEPAYADKARFMVTEAYPERHNPVASYMAFYEGVDPQVAAPFNFEGVSLPWQAADWHRFLRSFHTALQDESQACVASYAFGNHDKPRLASRIGPAAIRGAAVMLLTLPGMVFIYYGDEIGMADVPVAPDLIQDPAALGDPARGQGRDPARTPMQWDASRLAGFTSGQHSWLPLAKDFAQNNVDVQSRRPDSLLNLYRQLGTLRNTSAALRYGSIEVLDSGEPSVLAYIRASGTEKVGVLIHFGDSQVDVRLPFKLGECLANSCNQPASVTTNQHQTQLALAPYQAVVYAIVA